ncbi:MAG: hypothetical protein KC516_02310 [Nanoarchaeota archaeon]|nr:hypothetical protein [Nanoarchaeota archaeon]
MYREDQIKNLEIEISEIILKEKLKEIVTSKDLNGRPGNIPEERYTKMPEREEIRSYQPF